MLWIGSGRFDGRIGDGNGPRACRRPDDGIGPSAQADGPMPASGPRHVRGPSPSPIRPSKRPLPIHSTRCASYAGAGPRDGTVSLSQLMSSCSQETTARCECRV